MNASEFCFVCGTPGFFPAEDNLLCPDCTRVHAVGVAIAMPSDDEGGDDEGDGGWDMAGYAERFNDAVGGGDGEETDAMFPEFLHECMMHGEFSSAYSFLCPECRAQILVMAMAQRVSDDGEVIIIEGHFADRDSGDGCDDDDEGGD